MAICAFIKVSSVDLGLSLNRKYAQVVELVDTRDLKSLERIARAGSSPAPRTILRYFNKTIALSSYSI